MHAGRRIGATYSLRADAMRIVYALHHSPTRPPLPLCHICRSAELISGRMASAALSAHSRVHVGFRSMGTACSI
jgi:hypothetical protein